MGLRHEMIMARLEAECVHMQSNVRLTDLENNPNDATTTELEESADYISIHKEPDEPVMSQCLSQLKQKVQNFSLSHRARQSSMTFYNSARKGQQKCVTFDHTADTITGPYGPRQPK